MAHREEWPCDPKQYDGTSSACRIGRGAFSTVYRGFCLANQQQLAIKVMDLENISTSFEDILQEVQTMRLCDHENILRCYVSFVQSDKLWLCLELMNIGSCYRVMSIAKTMILGIILHYILILMLYIVSYNIIVPGHEMSLCSLSFCCLHMYV